jgi:hypothetical protein
LHYRELHESLDSFDKALEVDENEVITFIDKGDGFNKNVKHLKISRML